MCEPQNPRDEQAERKNKSKRNRRKEMPQEKHRRNRTARVSRTEVPEDNSKRNV